MLKYSIAAELLGAHGEIQGFQETLITNTTSSESGQLYGCIRLRDVELTAEDCVVEFLAAMGILKEMQEIQVFRLSLRAPVAPGETRSLRIRFSGVLPPDEVYSPKALSAALWYPSLFPPISSDADWSNWFRLFPPATFDVALTLPSDHNVAASADNLQESRDRKGNKRIEAHAEHYRELKWRSSSSYRVAASRSPGGEIRVLFTDREALQGPFVAAVAAEVSAYYAELLGTFPFPLVCFVPGRQDVSGGGEAGPRMLMLHRMHLLPVPDDGEDPTSTRLLVAHELGHLYWGTLAYVQIRAYLGWLGLGLGMWTDQQYVESIGIENANQAKFRRYLEAARAGYDTTIHQTEDQLRNAPFDVSLVIQHSKGFAVVSMLEYLMGKQKFLQLIASTLARYGGRWSQGRSVVLTEERFCSRAQEEHGADLSWFFEQWLYTNKSLDYGVGDVREDGVGLSVEVWRRGEAVMPVVVQVSTSSGSTLHKSAAGRAQVETIRFDELDSPWAEVVLDPAERLPDLDRANNVVRNDSRTSISRRQAPAISDGLPLHPFG